MDDVTRETAAEITQRSLRFDTDIWEQIKDRRRRPSRNMKRQAMVPDSAECFQMTWALLPGLPYRLAVMKLIILPGPHELRPMFGRYVMPLFRHMGERTTLVSRTLRFCDIGGLA